MKLNTLKHSNSYLIILGFLAYLIFRMTMGDTHPLIYEVTQNLQHSQLFIVFICLFFLNALGIIFLSTFTKNSSNKYLLLILSWIIHITTLLFGFLMGLIFIR
jgi:asparagine N-glycosylation enzyme membrane subunit Stt3